MKKIFCWGDSITRGMGMATDEKYPSYLQNFVGERYEVLNAGSSGEKSYEIAARQGAYKVYVTNDIVFDAGVQTVQIGDLNDNGFSLEDGTPISLNPQGEAFTNDVPAKTVHINGVEYTLTITWSDTVGREVFNLRRINTTEALTIPAGTEVVYDSAVKQQDNYCEIFYVGANDGFDWQTDRPTYVQRYKDMVARHGNDRYIIVLPTWTHMFDNALIEEFGDKCINLRTGTEVTRVMEAMGITPTEDDMLDIDQNLIPMAFTYNNERHNIHLNKDGYYYMATRIYEKGIELGYWN